MLAHQTNGARLVNAIVLLQKWNGMSIEEAKEVLRSKAIEEGQRYQQLKEEYIRSQGGQLSPTMEWWFYMVEALAAAGEMWHAFSYRHYAPNGTSYTDYYHKRVVEGAFKFKQTPQVSITSG